MTKPEGIDPDADNSPKRSSPVVLDYHAPERIERPPFWRYYLLGAMGFGPFAYWTLGHFKLRGGYNDTAIALPLAFFAALLTSACVLSAKRPDRLAPEKAVIAGAAPWIASLATLQVCILSFGRYTIASWP